MQEWTPTRSAALQALDCFLPKAGRAYAALRNYDRTQSDAPTTSALSPYLKRRLITEEEVCRAVVVRHGLAASEKFLAEVCWRTYWKGWLEHRPAMWPALEASTRDLQARFDTNAAYQAAMAGRTGIAAFDHWARSLVATGYLHNHVRMWFASIWLFTLDLPWELGAQFFARHLLDFDAASNTLSWRWVAGLHTAGKTYLARPDNIAKFTDDRFHPIEGTLAASAAPLAETLPVTALAMRTPDYGAGSEEAGDHALLITEEDCAPETETLPASRAVFGSVLRAAGANSDAAERFDRASVADALARNGGGVMLAPDEVIGQLRRAGVPCLVTLRLPQGPARLRFEALKIDAKQAGLCVVEYTRKWDCAFWPHARAGFFGLKKQIPKIFAQLGL
jgi:deoxyribodipyrimidine photo-lyase